MEDQPRQAGAVAPALDEEARREHRVEALAERLDPFMTFLGILFVLVVLGDTLVDSESPWDDIFFVAGWLLWAIFVFEFVLRLWLAPTKARFLRKNWWQILFLALPFLRFLRLVRLVRLGRAGRVISSAIRGSRTAGAEFRSRLAWLGAVTVLIILSAAQILFEFAGFEHFTDALHAAAYGAIAGEPVRSPAGIARLIELALALYSVVVFAAVAGTLSAYLLRQHRDRATTDVDDRPRHGPS